MEIAFDRVGLVGKKKIEFELYSDSERLSVDYGYYLSCIVLYLTLRREIISFRLSNLMWQNF